MSTKLVAFILGAGTHIGSAVASQLREKGYRVALGSRNPKPTSEDERPFQRQGRCSEAGEHRTGF